MAIKDSGQASLNDVLTFLKSVKNPKARIDIEGEIIGEPVGHENLKPPEAYKVIQNDYVSLSGTHDVTGTYELSENAYESSRTYEFTFKGRGGDPVGNLEVICFVKKEKSEETAEETQKQPCGILSYIINTICFWRR